MGCQLCYILSSLILSSIEIDTMPDKKFSKALLGLLLQHEGLKTRNWFPCSLFVSGNGRAIPLNEVRVVWSLVRVGRVAWVVCQPSWWCCIQRSCTVICFCSRVLRSRSWIFAFLYLFVHTLPQLLNYWAWMKLFLIP